MRQLWYTYDEIAIKLLIDDNLLADFIPMVYSKIGT